LNLIAFPPEIVGRNHNGGFNGTSVTRQNMGLIGFMNRRKQQSIRLKESGQGLVESACGTIMFVTVFVLLVMFALNVYIIITTDSVLRMVCMESARVREEYIYFLGMVRNDIDEAEGRRNATNFAVSLANANGLAVSADDVAFNDTKNADQAGTMCTINLKALKLPFGGGVFPLFVQRSVSAVSARMNVPAPAVVDICAPGEGGGITVRMPAYGAVRPISVANASNGRAALNRKDLFVSIPLPGVPLPGAIKFNHYYGLGIAPNCGYLGGPVSGKTGNYVTPFLLPKVPQGSFQVP
jgi:hypothetical protein